MGRLHLYLGTLTLTVVAVSLASCAERPLEPYAEPLGRACARPVSLGHWHNGMMHTIGTARHVCLCITEDEYESQSRLDEINELLLEDCKSDAEKWDFDWTECEQDFASKEWIGEDGWKVTWPTEEGVINPPGADLTCEW